MNQTEIDDKIQEARRYNAEKYLALAAEALKRNFKIDVDIRDCKWLVVANKLILKITCLVDGRTVTIRAVESVFKDSQRQVDANIGIKPEMKRRTKIILRLAYLLYTHRNDFQSYLIYFYFKKCLQICFITLYKVQALYNIISMNGILFL